MFVRLARGRGRDRRSQFAGITKEIRPRKVSSFFVVKTQGRGVPHYWNKPGKTIVTPATSRPKK